MLVLERKVMESIKVDGGIRIVVVSIGGDRVRIGIDAPPETTILRGELTDFRDEDGGGHDG